MDVTQYVFMISGLWDEISKEDKKKHSHQAPHLCLTVFSVTHKWQKKKKQMQIFFNVSKFSSGNVLLSEVK